MKDKKLEQIEQILMIHDPVGLIKKLGAPLDEYGSEALDIYERTNRYYTVERIQKIVYDIFVASFGSGSVYRMADGVEVKIGEEKLEREHVERLIGKFEDYRELAEGIKKILDTP